MTREIHKKRHTANAAVRIGAAAVLGAIIAANMAATNLSGAPWRDHAQFRAEYIKTAEPVKPDVVTDYLDKMTVPIPEADPLTFWKEIPLEPEVQSYIVELCDQNGIDPAIVFAIIWRESRYDADVIGDNGNAVGLMQIQERFHADRMARLGCDNLSNPLQNVTVGIDYLAELIGRQNGVEWAVMAYNAGATGANRRGGTSDYARDVLAEAERMRRDVFA